MRAGSAIALIAGLFYALTACKPAQSQSTAKPAVNAFEPRAVTVNSRQLSSFVKDGERSFKPGRLKWVGGLVLSSPDPAFGGYSGLEIDAGGRRFIAVSDAGSWLTGEIVYQGRRVSGVANTRSGPLKALANKPLSRPGDRDAEAVRLLSGNLRSGTVLISFEINQRIGVFPIRAGEVAGPLTYLRPRRRLPANKGLESVTVVGRGKKRDIVAFAERSRDPNGHHRGFLWRRGRGSPQPLALLDQKGFDITDAVGLPDGRLIVLERRFRWTEGVKMRIREIAAGRLRPGRVINGETLLTADLRYEIDNMEGIAAHRNDRGRIVLTLISDNNFNAFLQRTLLLQFELLE